MLTNEQIEQAYKRTREFVRDQANIHNRKVLELERIMESLRPTTDIAYHRGLRDMALKTLAVLRGCSYVELLDQLQKEGKV